MADKLPTPDELAKWAVENFSPEEIEHHVEQINRIPEVGDELAIMILQYLSDNSEIEIEHVPLVMIYTLVKVTLATVRTKESTRLLLLERMPPVVERYIEGFVEPLEEGSNGG